MDPDQTAPVGAVLSGSTMFASMLIVENKNDLELDFKVFFFTDSCCSDIVHDESN